MGGVTAAAAKFGVKPQGLSPYMSGRRLPGNKMRKRLQQLGFDDHLLMYGPVEETQKKFEKHTMQALRSAFPEKAAMLDALEENKIRTADELQRILDAYNAMKSVMKVPEPSSKRRKPK